MHAFQSFFYLIKTLTVTSFVLIKVLEARSQHLLRDACCAASKERPAFAKVCSVERWCGGKTIDFKWILLSVIVYIASVEAVRPLIQVPDARIQQTQVNWLNGCNHFGVAKYDYNQYCVKTLLMDVRAIRSQFWHQSPINQKLIIHVRRASDIGSYSSCLHWDTSRNP